jgi:hypothetical protein
LARAKGSHSLAYMTQRDVRLAPYHCLAGKQERTQSGTAAEVRALSTAWSTAGGEQNLDEVSTELFLDSRHTHMARLGSH